MRRRGRAGRFALVLIALAFVVSGCLDQPLPEADRERRVLDALARRDAQPPPPVALTPAMAVEYALANNLDARVAELELAYQNEALVAARRRLLPSLDARYALEHGNHPSARWSKSVEPSSRPAVVSSYSADPDVRRGDIGLVWSLLDFGVGYVKSMQQEEKIRNAQHQYRRARQQVALDVLSNYWRAAAVMQIASEAEALRKDLEDQAEAVRDSVEMRILTGAEGARRELAVHSSLSELDLWRKTAAQARLDLLRVLGAPDAGALELPPFPEDEPAPRIDPVQLQEAALRRRPELHQLDGQERIALADARISLLQMAPNANLSLSYYDDADRFLEWNNWMTVGARVSWNLLSIPARLSEKRMAEIQGETARRRGLALAAAVMAQVGIAYSEWTLGREYAGRLVDRTRARARLVEALALGERDGITRPGEVLQERVRLLGERAGALRALAEARVASARLANAVGLDLDDSGAYLWTLRPPTPARSGTPPEDAALAARARQRDRGNMAGAPAALSGVKVVMAEDFVAADEYFTDEERRAQGDR
ncbi:MAG: TolC family protein [Planctomycetota bacterium]|jgi:outer membrane protein TolC|nr:TolC family protein [Planctomycetota bacterium]